MSRYASRSILALVLVVNCAPVLARDAAQLPHSLTGTWGSDADACQSMASDGRLNIAPRELTFFASGCRVRSVRSTAANTWSVRASCQDEDGQPPVATRIDLRLTADGALAVSSTGQSYQRCARPMPVR